MPTACPCPNGQLDLQLALPGPSWHLLVDMLLLSANNPSHQAKYRSTIGCNQIDCLAAF